ncbi:MAG: cation:proton antiporter, partial [Cellulomonadaceae bacterium]
MDIALLGVLGVAAIAAVTALSPRIGVAAPLVLVLLGVGVSFLPFMPTIALDPEWILAGVLPPLLYSASVSMPTMDFRRDLVAISGLSVVLVIGSAVVLGLVVSWLLGVPLAVGIALGAILSPTDAVATSIVRRLGVSPRVVTVLEGESLLNDATALVLLRSALAATAATVSLWGVAGDFLKSVVIAVAIGLLAGRLGLLVRTHISDPAVNTAISFVVPFVAFLPTEHLGASGLVAAVAAGLVSGQGAPRYLSAQNRMSEVQNWRTLEVLLEGAVFLVMGLELKSLVLDARAEHGSLWVALGIGALAALVVVVLRTLFVVPLLVSLRRRSARGLARRSELLEWRDRLDSASATVEHRS